MQAKKREKTKQEKKKTEKKRNGLERTCVCYLKNGQLTYFDEITNFFLISECHICLYEISITNMDYIEYGMLSSAFRFNSKPEIIIKRPTLLLNVLFLVLLLLFQNRIYPQLNAKASNNMTFFTTSFNFPCQPPNRCCL